MNSPLHRVKQCEQFYARYEYYYHLHGMCSKKRSGRSSCFFFFRLSLPPSYIINFRERGDRRTHKEHVEKKKKLSLERTSRAACAVVTVNTSFFSHCLLSLSFIRTVSPSCQNMQRQQRQVLPTLVACLPFLPSQGSHQRNRNQIYGI